VGDAGLADDLVVEVECERAVVDDQAEEAHYGLNDSFQDMGAAIKLYAQATKLGGVLPYMSLGIIYRDDEAFQDYQLSIKYFKEGAAKGLVACYAEMSDVFCYQNDISNALKCWDKYFASDLSALSIKEITKHALTYIRQHQNFGLELIYLDLIMPIRDNIKYDIQQGLSQFANNDTIVNFYTKLDHTVDCVLYGMKNENISEGKIKWFDKSKGIGFIEHGNGEADVFIEKSAIKGNCYSIYPGQKVEFTIYQSELGPIANSVKLL